MGAIPTRLGFLRLISSQNLFQEIIDFTLKLSLSPLWTRSPPNLRFILISAETFNEIRNESKYRKEDKQQRDDRAKIECQNRNVL